MKFGVREICDVVLKAKATMPVGNKVFYAGEPVIYFDTLKTSSMEGTSTTVYAQGGRGNARLMAWDGERTVTFTMEDALISPEGFMILSGAGLIEADSENTIKQHVTEIVTCSASNVDDEGKLTIPALKKEPYDADDGNYIYVMLMNKGEIVSEPYIAVKSADGGLNVLIAEKNKDAAAGGETDSSYTHSAKDVVFDSALVDYYIERTANARQINISPDSFGGNFYLEASTLFRDTNGIDMPAEFIIPNCKVQSNFTFTMASSGDPSTFTFTMDAFPDYTRFDKEEKVFASIQIIEDSIDEMGEYRKSTPYAFEEEEEDTP